MQAQVVPKKGRPRTNNGSCSVAGCLNAHSAMGLCHNHYMNQYQREVRKGVRVPVKDSKAGRPKEHTECSVEGCTQPHSAKGLCRAHRKRQKEGKSLQRVCSVNACCKRNFRDGYCGPHWERWQKYGDPETYVWQGRLPHGASAEERFWAKVDKEGPIPIKHPELGPCWIWIGGCNSGYGQFSGYGSLGMGDFTSGLAHRISYELTYGSVPQDYHVHHRCEVTRCVNPAHLEALTCAEHKQRHLAA